ncbi:hypothetical protein K8640_03610 [Myxococcus sp. XM-1-1-1]|uniref:hypothetical protein n=1 Tax=Myxococcus sp. XM-1-1-1 TaxID=2874602 RepID=UPI001CC02392|nr:hypothetical protein [Myxococcus sp. XM-1-1-1]MBZ4407284.1 hypothetical protein [Myxococcus sp. XM-1-1-1]
MNDLPTSIVIAVPIVEEATRWFRARFPTAAIASQGALAVVHLGDTRVVLLHGPRGRTRQILVEVNPKDVPLHPANDVEVQVRAKTLLGSRWATLMMPDQTTQLVLVTPVPALNKYQLEQVRQVLRPLKEKVARWHEGVKGHLESIWNKELDRLLEKEGPHQIKWIVAGINPGKLEARDGRYLHPAGPSGAPMHVLLRHDVPSWDFVLALNQTSLASSNMDELDDLSPKQQEILDESLLAMAEAIGQLAQITGAHVWILGNKELFARKTSTMRFYPFFQRLAKRTSEDPTLHDRLYLSNHPSRGSLFSELPMTDEILDHGLEVALRQHCLPLRP